MAEGNRAPDTGKQVSQSDQDFRKVAIDTALAAGRLLRSRLKHHNKVDFKGAFNLVTEADYTSEALILQEIAEKFPNHSFLSEETGEKQGDPQYLWVIDPLDGTTNFAHGFPIFAVSIALVIEDEAVLGVVYDPNQDELFVAEKGRGAFLNEEPLHISEVSDLSQALLATGFPYTVRETPGRLFQYFEAFYLKCQGVRRCGAAALDLAYLASGRLDGFWEAGLAPWDTAAASLLVSEAGGVSTRFGGKPFDRSVPEIIAGNPSIHSEMLKVMEDVDAANEGSRQ